MSDLLKDCTAYAKWNPPVSAQHPPVDASGKLIDFDKVATIRVIVKWCDDPVFYECMASVRKDDSMQFGLMVMYYLWGDEHQCGLHQVVAWRINV